MADAGEPSWTARLGSVVREAVRGLGLTGADNEEADVLRASLEDWLDGESLRAFVAGVGRDQVTAPEEQITLTVRLSRIARLRAERVRFFVGGRAVGEVEVGHADLVSLPHRCDAPGLFEVGFEPVDADGVPGRRAASARLHVVPRGEPLAAVDVGRIVDEDLEMVQACRRLRDAGFVLVYLDLAEAPRDEVIRNALARFGLPEGAVLDHPLEPGEFDPLGVDFRPVFLANTLRGIRAAGLCLTLLVGEQGEPWELVEKESLRRMSPKDVNEACATAAGREQLLASAEAFAAAWAARPSDLRFRLDLMTGSKPVEGNRFEVQLDNRAARERLLELVGQAERTVHLQFYIFEAGRFTEALADALLERAAAGVTVRLVVDALYSQEDVLGFENGALDRLRGAAGVQVLAADPLSEPELIEALSLRQRDHRKLAVFDGEVALVSGRNAADAYYFGFDEVAVDRSTPHDRIPWFDAHVELRGPLVAAVERTFVHNWNRGALTTISMRDEQVDPPAAGSSAGRLVVHDGVRDADGLGAYVALLDGARDHVFIVNDFPLMTTLADAVRRALARGVRVMFLTGCAVPRTIEGELLDGPLHRTLFEYMTKARLEPLLVAGAEGYELTTPALDGVGLPGRAYRPYVHAKVVSVDGLAASIGSANLDVTASYWEREANVIIECEQVVGALEAELELWRRRAHRLHVEDAYWQREAMQRQLTSRLWLDLLYPA